MLERPPLPKARNPRAQALTRRESIWQIAAPIVLAVLGAGTLMVLTVTATGPSARSTFADVSLIFLILPVAIWGIILLAFIVAACIGLGFALRELPYLFRRAQDFTLLTASWVRQGAGYISGGVLSVRSVIAAVRKTSADLRSIFTPGRPA